MVQAGKAVCCACELAVVSPEGVGAAGCTSCVTAFAWAASVAGVNGNGWVCMGGGLLRAGDGIILAGLAWCIAGRRMSARAGVATGCAAFAASGDPTLSKLLERNLCQNVLYFASSTGVRRGSAFSVSETWARDE